jgi:ribonuclease P protein component
MKKFVSLTGKDFRRIYDKKTHSYKSHAHPLVALVTSPNAEQKARIGVVAGLRVGGAVQRNLAKRRIRAVAHSFIPKIKPGWDLIFIARQPMATAGFTEIQQAMVSLIKRAGMFKTESNGNASAARISE